MTRLGFVACALVLTGCPGASDSSDGAFAPAGKLVSWSKGEGYQLVATLRRHDRAGKPIVDADGAHDLATADIAKDGTFAMKPLPAPPTDVLLSEPVDAAAPDWCPVHPVATPGRYGTVEIIFMLRDPAGNRSRAILDRDDDRTIVYSDSDAAVTGALSCPAHNGAAAVEERYAMHLVSGYNAIVSRLVARDGQGFTWYGSVELPNPLTLRALDPAQ
jgi:hypothetical protein